MNVNEIFYAARTAHQAGRLAVAEAQYRQVLATMPDHADALHLLGVLAYQTRHNEPALQLIGKAIQINPASAEYYANQSVVLTALGRYTEAMDAIAKALQRDPQNAEHLNNRGVTQMRMQQWEPAANSFRAALAIRPEFNLPQLNLNELQQLAEKAREESGIVTNPFRTDGFGAQFQTIIYSLIYAELNNRRFVYTPFGEMAHNYNNDPQFLEKKENLINFKSNFEINPGVGQSIVREDFIRFFERNLDRCASSESLKKIKSIFRANKNLAKSGTTDVAMHVRRPNPHDNRKEGTDTPDSIYLEMIDSLKAAYPGRLLRFHIHSQGTLDLFNAYEKVGDVYLHLNESIEETFTAMVLADVLVTSRSSFSYVAGLLSEGEVFYLPFWHPPLKHWRVIGSSS